MDSHVIFHIEVKPNAVVKDELILCVTSIRRANEDVLYLVPDKLQAEDRHVELFNLPVVITAVKNLSKEGQYRNVRVTLKDPLKKIYMDEDGNFVFENEFLVETGVKSRRSEILKGPPLLTADADVFSKTQLIEILNALKVAEEKAGKTSSPEDQLRKVEKQFSIEKYNGKQKAKDWLDNFEAECSRYNIVDPAQKVKCLKLFMEERAMDWYQGNKIKLSQDSWTEWSESFVKVFSEKGWSKLRYAYGYKYLTGSMIEYALKKERMLLEIESTMSTPTRISLIVLGLPLGVQDKLDRELLLSTDDLVNKLGQFDFASKTSRAAGAGDEKGSERKTPAKRGQEAEKFIEKKPCHICESLNFPGRFHAPDKCRNKDRVAGKMKINASEVTLNEAGSGVGLEIQGN